MDKSFFRFHARLCEETVCKFLSEARGSLRLSVPGEGIQDRTTWQGWLTSLGDTTKCCACACRSARQRAPGAGVAAPKRTPLGQSLKGVTRGGVSDCSTAPFVSNSVSREHNHLVNGGAMCLLLVEALQTLAPYQNACCVSETRLQWAALGHLAILSSPGEKLMTWCQVSIAFLPSAQCIIHVRSMTGMTAEDPHTGTAPGHATSLAISSARRRTTTSAGLC